MAKKNQELTNTDVIADMGDVSTPVSKTADLGKLPPLKKFAKFKKGGK